jgi:hypothetical protein
MIPESSVTNRLCQKQALCRRPYGARLQRKSPAADVEQCVAQYRHIAAQFNSNAAVVLVNAAQNTTKTIAHTAMQELNRAWLLYFLNAAFLFLTGLSR